MKMANSSHKINLDIDNDSINHTDKDDDILVTPWEVQGDLEEKNYAKLIEKFGTQALSIELIKKLQKLTGEVHPLVKSQYFFSHRDLDWLLNKYEQGEPFYLYTGRGPSGSRLAAVRRSHRRSRFCLSTARASASPAP